jgi:CHAT domain-containing protein
VTEYTEDAALEAELKGSYKPRVLHVATHGFFKTGLQANPLVRSGLMLAGAGTSLKGQKPETGEDGILSAYEAMNLNLDNTDPVVLSACETGLGELKNGEGVYGLQRAFKAASVKSIIMSLWKVDDAATQELMVSFYKHWGPQIRLGGGLKDKNTNGKVALSPPSGDLVGPKRSAFLAAQKELKAKYPNPNYWGAFVMVGE